MSELLKRLRVRTQVFHSRLEALVPVMEPGFSREDYTALLGRFHGYYFGVQTMLRGYPDMPEPFPAWLDDKRVKWLDADLRYFGYTDSAIACLPVCSDLPVLRTPASLLGATYVFEGSSLGGQILSQHLGKRWGLRQDAGAAFFSAYGVKTGKNWTAFLELLSAQDEPASQESTIEAAVATFQSFQTWLSAKEYKTSSTREASPFLRMSRAAAQTR